ncbi:MAG TPA: type II toxin-antitoxin system PemK/MazF family toxin [Bryobacteraceae bacterium]|jgi:mRNA interferase MazF
MATHRPASKEHQQQAHPKRGEIYLTALDPTVGSEIKKISPALVIQNNTSNRVTTTTIVAPITSTVRSPLNPVHALLVADAVTGLSVPSVALLNQIRVVDRQRLVTRIGSVDSNTMREVEAAIKISLAIP